MPTFWGTLGACRRPAPGPRVKGRRMPGESWDVSRRGFIAGSVVTALAGSAGAAGATEPAPGVAGVDWRGSLGQQDLVWKRLPTDWWQGPFLGDGLLGTMVYKEPGKNQIRFTTQHSLAQDYRPEFGSAWGVCRLPVGHLTLEPAGTISKVDWRLDLHDA